MATNDVVVNGDEQVTSKPNGNVSRAATTVLIVGGGPVGCLTALKLAQAGINVTIIEKLSAPHQGPRACGYFGPVQRVFDELGVYDTIRKAGFMTKGLCWRKKPVADGKDGKRHGDMIAGQAVCRLDDDIMPAGTGSLHLPQSQLNAILLQEVLDTGRVDVRFNTELEAIVDNNENGVVVSTRDVVTGAQSHFEAAYLVGADGGRSAVRKALKLPFAGHTWPERLVATDVLLKNDEIPIFPTYFVMDPIHYAISTPLENPVAGQRTLWRFTIASDPNDTRPEEDLLSDDNIMGLYEDTVPGARPLDVKITNRAIYRIHQRLVPTMRRGRCLLAGDAAHVNNPFGALGLNTGLLDAEAAAAALMMILNDGADPDQVLDYYSDNRRKVFQNFVDPASTHHKLRLHTLDADTAAQDDWLLRMLKKGPTMEERRELMRPFEEVWRTDMRRALG